MNQSASMFVELERIVGVRPTRHWFNDCIQALHQEPSYANLSGSDLSAAVVQQILYHDLRDVVRNLGEINNVQNEANASSQILRTAIRRSLDAESNFKATLPDSFRLLVQIEEYVDVALNSEKRLEMAIGNNDSGIPQQSSNSANRCLKFCYSDGHRWSNDSILTSPLIAMEVTPINGLGAQYPLLAGLKVLLHGPIIIRHGIAGWNSGNATVLGGKVQSLIEIQKETLDREKRISGHGVDPTIRALIWNNPNHPTGEGINEEVTDEAEHGSHSNTAVDGTHMQSLTNHVLPANEQVARQPQNQLPVRENRDEQIQHSQPILPDVTDVPRDPIFSESTNHVAEARRVRREQLPTTNPYLKNNNFSSLQSQSPAVSTATRAEIVPTLGANRLNTQCDYSITAASLSFTRASNLTSSVASMTSSSTKIIDNNSSILPEPRIEQTVTTKIAAIPSIPSTAAPLSFQRLWELLSKAITNETIYRVTFGQTYIVHNLKQIGNKLYFNIEKRKTERSDTTTKKSKYEYVMTAKFKDESTDAGEITCKVSSSIIEAVFALPPGEMRKLNKDDRSKADMLVKEGGQRLYQTTLQPCCYELTLLQPPEELFRKEGPVLLDGNSPILGLLKRC